MKCIEQTIECNNDHCMIYGGTPCYLLMNNSTGYSLAFVRLSVIFFLESLLVMCRRNE